MPPRKILETWATADEAFARKSYRRSFAVTPLGKRPVCPNCDKVFGTRAIRKLPDVRLAIGDPVPPYKGNMPLVEESLVVTPHDAWLYRLAWDRVSYDGSGRALPFCTAACAIAFAKRAYQKLTALTLR